MKWCTAVVVFETPSVTKVAKCSGSEAKEVAQEWLKEYLISVPNGIYQLRYYYTVLEPLKEVSEIYP